MIQQSWNGDKPLSIFQHGLAGLAGGLTVSFVATPVEQIKARLQVQYDGGVKTYKGPIDCIRKVVNVKNYKYLFLQFLKLFTFLGSK